ncbi:MAG: DnaJ domain-containing protein [Chromatiales bacterium]|nr:DnaJ domain-containing protein [Chromatiales bacterium]
MQFKDYYQTMGVARDATPDDIKRAYRKLARKYHPDVSKEPEAEARFKEVGEAYEVLRDPDKRAAYDQLGADWKSGQEFRPPPDWGARSATAGPTDFSDFFEALYGRGAAGGRAEHARFSLNGEDQHARLVISLEDAWKESTQTLTLRSPELDEQGRVALRERTLSVRVPRGVRPGQHIRLAGQGASGIGDGKRGDLYLEIGFRQHPLYRIRDLDVYLDLPLAPWEAALGATLKLPTPDGTVELKVPPGTPAGRKLRLKGRGIPANPPGDFYAVAQIALPPASDPAARAIYQKMSEHFSSYNPRASLGV